MELPEWAKRALEHFRPQAAYRSDGPNPERLKQFIGFSERFSKRWQDLDPENWRVPKDHPKYAYLHVNYKFPPDEYVKQCILECAVESAWEMGANQNPGDVIQAVKELDSLNDQISEMAGNLAALFRQRQTLVETYGLTDQQIDFDESAPDPFKLFQALELALTRPGVRTWAYVANQEIDAFFNMVATQSRSKPTWALMLDELSYRSPRTIGVLDAGDIAVIGSKSNKSAWSPWALRTIGRLDDWAGNGLPKGFFLECLTHQQLATLMEVSTDAPPGVFSASQMKELIKRYRKRTEI